MIKTFVVDVDGTLTDGMCCVNEKGVISKSFFTRDFVGLRILHERKVKVVIMTSSEDDVIYKKCKESIHFATVFSGCVSKLDKFIVEFDEASLEETAFMSDDIFDLDFLKRVGIAGCPLDAHDDVIEYLKNKEDGFFSDFCGGHGAVRQFAEHVCSINNSNILRTIL